MTEPSGAAWCSRYPTSVSLDDLAPAFGAKVKSFITAIKGGGGEVGITCTLRPKQRAYLMHFCCKIAEGLDPSEVPALAGVDIDWTQDGNDEAAVAAARAMKAAYGIVYPAALDSRHTDGLAIDMQIVVHQGANIRDAKGDNYRFDGPADGRDPRVVEIGATYGVIKLLSDPPHWSVDGH